jgi:hypothetical protein
MSGDVRSAHEEPGCSLVAGFAFWAVGVATPLAMLALALGNATAYDFVVLFAGAVGAVLLPIVFIRQAGWTLLASVCTGVAVSLLVAGVLVGVGPRGDYFRCLGDHLTDGYPATCQA